MKTVLIGGPLDGKVIETRKNEFGYSEVKEVWNNNVLVSTEEITYKNAYKYIKHPCKKKGTARTFEYAPYGIWDERKPSEAA